VETGFLVRAGWLFNRFSESWVMSDLVCGMSLLSAQPVNAKSLPRVAICGEFNPLG
jgi:hypothetical protein